MDIKKQLLLQSVRIKKSNSSIGIILQDIVVINTLVAFSETKEQEKGCIQIICGDLSGGWKYIKEFEGAKIEANNYADIIDTIRSLFIDAQYLKVIEAVESSDLIDFVSPEYIKLIKEECNNETSASVSSG